MKKVRKKSWKDARKKIGKIARKPTHEKKMFQNVKLSVFRM